jgi:hypothetical protein
LAVAVALGTAIGLGGVGHAQAAPSASATLNAIGAPTAERCWCFDRSDVAFGRRFFRSPRRFDFGTRRFGWRGNFRSAPGRFRAPGWPGVFGAPGQYGAPRTGDFGPPSGRDQSYGMPGRDRGDARWLKNEVYLLTNEERARAECRRLRFDDTLGVTAQDHSQDMAVHHYMSHISQDNEDPGLRMERSGYPIRYGWAENIAYGSRTAEQVVDNWMTSPGHRRNILNCRFRAIGVGVARAQDGTLYWTQNFGGR